MNLLKFVTLDTDPCEALEIPGKHAQRSEVELKGISGPQGVHAVEWRG